MFVPTSSGSSDQANWNQVNSLAKDVQNSKVTQVFNDSTDRRVLLGKGKDDFYGLKVSKPGFDVYDATDDELAFNSDQNVFKIVLSGTTSVSISGSFPSFVPQTATVAHGLGTTPAFTVYVENPNYSTLTGLIASSGQGLTATPFTVYYNNSVTVEALLTISARADATNLYIDIINLTLVSTGFPSWTWNLKYYIMQETAK